MKSKPPIPKKRPPRVALNMKISPEAKGMLVAIAWKWATTQAAALENIIRDRADIELQRAAGKGKRPL